MKSMRKPLKLDIQFFAEAGDDASKSPVETTETNQQTDDSQENSTKKVELTETELQKKIEAESDRKLAKALEKQKADWQAQQEAAIQEALEKEKKLSKLSEKERKDAELSEREKALQNRLAEIEQKELKADAIAVLSEKKLPSSFADFLLADNAENTLKNINAFKDSYDAAVNEAVKEKLRQDPPKTGGGLGANDSKTVDKAEMARKARIIK